jgi:hypothetical protein
MYFLNPPPRTPIIATHYKGALCGKRHQNPADTASRQSLLPVNKNHGMSAIDDLSLVHINIVFKNQQATSGSRVRASLRPGSWPSRRKFRDAANARHPVVCGLVRGLL